MKYDIETMRSFTEIGFDRLDRALHDIDEEQLDWKSCPEANTIRWILTHLSQELHVYVPRILTGNKDFFPNDWPEDYVGNENYSMQKIMKDLNEGREQLFQKFSSLTEEDLSEEINYWMGKKKKAFYLMMLISEILHHEGQIAAIRGLEKRIKGLE